MTKVRTTAWKMRKEEDKYKAERESHMEKMKENGELDKKSGAC